MFNNGSDDTDKQADDDGKFGDGSRIMEVYDIGWGKAVAQGKGG